MTSTELPKKGRLLYGLCDVCNEWHNEPFCEGKAFLAEVEKEEGKYYNYEDLKSWFQYDYKVKTKILTLEKFEELSKCGETE